MYILNIINSSTVEIYSTSIMKSMKEIPALHDTDKIWTKKKEKRKKYNCAVLNPIVFDQETFFTVIYLHLYSLICLSNPI